MLLSTRRRCANLWPKSVIVLLTFTIAYFAYHPGSRDVHLFTSGRHLLQQQKEDEERVVVSESEPDLEISVESNYTSPVDDPLFPPDLFTEQQRKHGAVILHILGIVYMFYALALVCDEFFVPSLDVITEKLGISPDVAGATFMAAGGSAPELFTSVIGVFIAKSDVGIGTIVGSAVFNILFVIAACAFAAKEALCLTAWPLIRDVFFYSVSLIVLVLFFMDNNIYWWEALILFLWYFAYVGFMKFNEPVEDFLRKMCRLQPSNREGLERGVTLRNAVYRKGLYHLMNETINPGIIKGKKKDHFGENGEEMVPLQKGLMIGHQQAAAGITGLKTTLQPPNPEGGETGTNNEIVEPENEMTPNIEIEPNNDGAVGHEEGEEEKKEESGEEEPIDMSFPINDGWKKILLYLVSFPIMAPLYVTLPDTKNEKKRKFFIITFVGSVLWIAVYSYLMVWWATVAGDTIGIPPPVMGLTFLAAGTSVPDLITSVLVAKQGKGDMAVSSSVGSNIFDVTVGLPFPWLLWTLCNYPTPVSVSSSGVGCSVSLLFLMLIAVFLSILAFDWKMTKGMGVVMGLLYFVFVVISLGFTYDWYSCFI